MIVDVGDMMPMERFAELDLVGVLEGSDKSSSVRSGWDYLRHYDRHFAKWRDAPINLIEVGVSRGASLKAWKWYFSQAQIVGIDIDPTCADLAQERVRIEIGSQADAGFLRAVCGASPPTIFIDDGSHLAGHIVFTLETVFPLLEAGGVYVIEDLAFHGNTFPGQWQSETKVNLPEYFAKLMLPLMLREEPAGGGAGGCGGYRQHRHRARRVADPQETAAFRHARCGCRGEDIPGRFQEIARA